MEPPALKAPRQETHLRFLFTTLLLRVKQGRSWKNKGMQIWLKEKIIHFRHVNNLSLGWGAALDL